MIFLNVIFNFRFVPNNAIIKLVILRVFPPVLSHWKNKLSITKLILFLPARNVNRSKSSSQPNFLFVLFSVASQHIKLGKKIALQGLTIKPIACTLLIWEHVALFQPLLCRSSSPFKCPTGENPRPLHRPSPPCGLHLFPRK